MTESNPQNLIKPESQLKKFFGFDNFKKPQKEIIYGILKKQHSLIIMPTGWGKSLCYQIPALCQSNSLTLVISPLIALMKDQVDQLKQKQIPAEALHSALSKKEKERILKIQLKKNILYSMSHRKDLEKNLLWIV